MRADTIDVHTHVFNLRYLPLEGILRHRLRGLGPLKIPIADGIAKLMNAITHDGSGLGTPPRPAPGPDLAGVFAAEATPGTFDDVLTQLAGEAPTELRFDPQVAAGIAAAAATGGAPPPDLAAAAATAGATNDFATLLSKLRLFDIEGLFATVEDFINWFGFLRHDETFIMKRLFATYPVDLYIHHMMDLEHYYKPGKCYYKFNAEQIQRTRRLVESSGGKLMTFVAWSPSRSSPENLKLVEETVLSGGAIGVKVYPASGYRADDARNDALWALCLQHDIPIFTHCMTGGFEAKNGSGRSNPKFWADVLARPGHGKLRLCFGHAGGQPGWFDRYSKKANAEEKNWETSYAKQVVDLCVKHENVYCETGFLSEALDNPKPFIDRLTGCILQNATFAKKIMYGTDWHMIERIDTHTKYFEAFQRIFEQPVLDRFKDLFFYANAVQFLNLQGFTARQAGSAVFDVNAVAPHLEMVQQKADAMRQ